MSRMRILTVAVTSLGFLWAAPPPRKISFARAGGVVPGTMHLFVSTSDGSDEHPLLAEPHDDYDAVWAPDGQSIVFTSDRNGSGDLFRVDADGTRLTQLPSDARMEKKFMRPACSISVSRRGALGSGLHLANLFRGRGRATDCLCLGGFFPGDNVPGNSTRRVAMSVPRTGSASSGIPL